MNVHANFCKRFRGNKLHHKVSLSQGLYLGVFLFFSPGMVLFKVRLVEASSNYIQETPQSVQL